MPLSCLKRGIPKKLHRNVIKFVRFERRWKTSSRGGREWTTYGPPPPINVNRCFVVGRAKLAGVTVTKCAAVWENGGLVEMARKMLPREQKLHAQGYLWLCSRVDESSVHSRPIFSRVRFTRERRVLRTNEDDLGEIIENGTNEIVGDWKFYRYIRALIFY